MTDPVAGQTAAPVVREWAKLALSVRAGEYVPVAVYENETQGSGNARDEHNAAILHLISRAEAATASLARMRAALVKYGEHKAHCDTTPQSFTGKGKSYICTCGLTEALAAPAWEGEISGG